MTYFRMLTRVIDRACFSSTTAVLWKRLLSVSCETCEKVSYKPKVLDTKSRNSSKVRKVNLSRKLREEFSKYKGKTPLISCKRREFDFYEGMKYGKFEAVPLASKGWLNRASNGDFFTIYENYMASDDFHFGNVRIPNLKGDDFDFNPIIPTEEPKQVDGITVFSQLGIESHLLQNLNKFGITKPADIQVASIPHILQEKNCIVAAHTGCGKTLAYLLPVVQMVLKRTQEEAGGRVPLNSPTAVIVTPSRELTYQIYGVLRKLLEGLPLKTKIVVGGYHSDDVEESDDSDLVDIVVGSLGTLCNKFKGGVLSTERIKHIVLDEADQLVDDQNYFKIQKLLRKVLIKQNLEEQELHLGLTSVGAQLLLVSATIPVNLHRTFEEIVDVDSLERISSSHLHNVLQNVPQLFLKVGKIHKGKALIDLVEKDQKAKRPVLIFSNKIKTADWVSLQLSDVGFPCKNLTSNVPTEIRQHLFEEFQQGKFDILSTTAMAARGLDTVRVKHIINFDFPLYVSEYIHQIGRVGRIGSGSCHITNIVAHPREIQLVQKIELAVRLGTSLNAVNANIPGIVRHRSEREMDL